NLVRAGVADAEAIAARFAGHVDAWTAEWSARRTAVCEAMIHNPRGDGDALAEEVECLARHLTGLDSVVTLCTHATLADVAMRADRLVAELEPARTCEVRGGGRPDQARRDRVAPAIQRLVAAKAAIGTGQLDAAVRAATEAASLVAKLDD